MMAHGAEHALATFAHAWRCPGQMHRIRAVYERSLGLFQGAARAESLVSQRHDYFFQSFLFLLLCFQAGMQASRQLRVSGKEPNGQQAAFTILAAVRGRHASGAHTREQRANMRASLPCFCFEY